MSDISTSSDEGIDKLSDEERRSLEQFAELAFDIYRWQKSMEKRLESEPGGFAFPADGRMCSVCLGGGSGELWYDELGMRCMDCERAYKAKIIPAYVIKDRENKRWMTNYRLSSRSGMDIKTIKRLVKANELKARVIEREPYSATIIFLKNENPSLLNYFG